MISNNKWLEKWATLKLVLLLFWSSDTKHLYIKIDRVYHGWIVEGEKYYER